MATDAQLKALWATLEAVKVGETRYDRDAYSSAAALQLALLTLQRRGEVASIHRDDVDFINDVWTIPANRKKERRRAIVPLAPAAAELLAQAFARSNGPWAFAGSDADKHVTPHALTRFMARLREDDGTLGDVTPHDLRRTGRTRLTESLNIDPDTAERILGHVVGSRQSRAYDHGLYIRQRADALKTWESELMRIVAATPAKTSNVVVPTRQPRAERSREPQTVEN